MGVQNLMINPVLRLAKLESGKPVFFKHPEEELND
jgi:hypothetical protein